MTRAGVSDKDIWEYSVGTRALLRMQLKSLRLVWNIWCHLAYILDNWVRWLPIFPCYICSWWPNNYQGIRFWLGRRSNLKLRYMLACTDEEFNKKVEAIVKTEKVSKIWSWTFGGDLSDSQATDDPVETTKLSESEST